TGDFDGDGHADLAVANGASNDVSILLGLGDGSFHPLAPISLGMNATPVAIVAADFNGDGLSDLAVADNESSDVSILLSNRSTPRILTRADSPLQLPVMPTALATADLNQDGIVDLVIAGVDLLSDQQGDVIVLRGKADGKFEDPVIVAAYSGTQADPKGIVAGDFDGDTRPDLAVVDDDLNQVVVFKNPGTPTFDSGSFTPTMPPVQFDATAVSSALVADHFDDHR